MTANLHGGYSEDSLVEQPAIALFAELGWGTANCYHEFDGGKSTLGRDSTGEVVLIQRLRLAIERLNPELPSEAAELAVQEILRDRSIMDMEAANRDVYHLLKNGVKVTFRSSKDDEGRITENVKVIDWNDVSKNDFFLASQFWVSGEMYTKRPDLVGFINGLPFILIELKATHEPVKSALDRNISDYKETIPHIFWYNAFIIISNGSESRIGSVSAEWEHFTDWKKINSEGEEGIVSMDTIIKGTCRPDRLLDIIENFTVFMAVRGGQVKLVARNHQYLGVANAIEALQRIGENPGQLGVFWHTQGSGKSVSMIYFAQKVLRKIPGRWTFVVVTDRQELDNQIYKNFSNSGVITEPECQATSGEHLRQLLREDHRYIFTLIHKFRTDEKLTDRSDIIVITDEAHRTQYDVLAMNMRSAMPNAAFIAFTGTPLIAGEQKTREVFGDYVSIYDFKQSIEDNATVPLFYENRIPELQIINENFREDMESLLEEAELDEAQERRLQREFGKEYNLITREERLETIGKDIVTHFMGRGYYGKAMVVCIDKAAAIRMYDKVQKYWKQYLADLELQLYSVRGEELEELNTKIQFMKQTDMAVVVSPGQNEISQLAKKGLDIRPHRKRMVTEDMDTKFKDPDDPFRIVFVCAMWMTGFDVPCCSTIYLDKPMRNHTLMQTIARANRVFKDKHNGLIVDYIGVFRNLEKALAIYATGGKHGEPPVVDKIELIKQLQKAIVKASAFCRKYGIELKTVIKAEPFKRIKLIDDAVDALMLNDHTKQQFLSMADTVITLYRAILPDTQAGKFEPSCSLIRALARKIRSHMEPPDISSVMMSIEQLLDKSVGTEGYIIKIKGKGPKNSYGEDVRQDLSKIDFEKLRKRFEKSRKHTEAEKLKAILQAKVGEMVQLNRSRFDYSERLQQMIDDYNTGSINIDELYNHLIDFAQSLDEEDKRSIKEGLTEEELAVFDLLTKPEMKLKRKEEQQVKKVARDLLNTLKAEKLVLDWRKRQQSRAAVRVAIEEVLDKLPDCYTEDIFNRKVGFIYEHIYEAYYGAGKSLYTAAS